MALSLTEKVVHVQNPRLKPRLNTRPFRGNMPTHEIMHKIAFHRRILPWIFVLVFLVMAPAVVFYTAGYRWNQKKGVLERNGTLILDTMPVGASIDLNGQRQTDITPVTLQNVAPGSYDISLTLQGYHPWSKTLYVEPERVTFASQILLWPIAEPQRVIQENICKTYGDPEGNLLLVATCIDNNITSLKIIESKTSKVRGTLQVNEIMNIDQADWHESDGQALIYGQSSGTPATWLMESSPASLTRLPAGTYHWNGSRINGVADDQLLTIQTNGSLERQNKSPQVRDVLQNATLKHVSGTADLVLVLDEHTNQGIVLPPGNWNFHSQNNSALLLKDGDNWLWLDTSQNPVHSLLAQGAWPMPLTIKRQINYLLVNDNEVWTWLPSSDPLLIYRQSDPVRAAAWHTAGRDILVATDKEVLMFNLDDRNGRYRTTLATFDRIFDATIQNDAAFVAGVKDGNPGLWRLPLTTEKIFAPLGKLY